MQREKLPWGFDSGRQWLSLKQQHCTRMENVEVWLDETRPLLVVNQCRR